MLAAHARSDCHVSDSYACVVVVAPPPLLLVPFGELAPWLTTFNYLKLHLTYDWSLESGKPSEICVFLTAAKYVLRVCGDRLASARYEMNEHSVFSWCGEWAEDVECYTKCVKSFEC